MGTPHFAETIVQSLVDAKYNVVAVYTQPDRPSGLTSIMHDAAQRQSVLPKHGGPEL